MALCRAIALHLVFVLHVQEVGTQRVRQEVEQTKDTGGNVGASGPVEHSGPGGQLADKGDEVEGSRQSGVDQLLEERMLRLSGRGQWEMYRELTVRIQWMGMVSTSRIPSR